MKNKSYLKYPIYILLSLIPVLALADVRLTTTNFKDTVFYIIEVINILNPLLIGTAFIVFFWGLSKFILNSNNKVELDKGKSYMAWGILALFILLTFRAIVGYISKDLEINNGEPVPNVNNILLPH